MKRRTFLQLTGMSTAGTLLAGCRQGNEKLIPFLIAPDDGIVPGVADWYASTCGQCPAGCGILVRVAEGRAKKIEGNPRHPVNRGRLCARGQAALQELYHPDRIRQPLKRTGPRGSGRFTPVSWEEALDILAGELANLTKGLAFLTPPLTGSLAELTGRFLASLGSPPEAHLAWDLLHPEWQLDAALASYGIEALPDYDLANTQHLLAFGADFLETFLSPVRYGEAFGRMRQARTTVRGLFTYVGARLSLTAASADRWLPARPGSEGVVALGIAREIVRSGRFDRRALDEAGLDPAGLAAFLEGYDLATVAGATGVAEATLRVAANDFATIRPALAMPGAMTAWQSNGLETVKAVQLLNILAGNLNRPGGVYLTPADGGRWSRHRDLRRLISRMEAGEIGAALVYRANPVHTVPAALGFETALAKVPLLVSFTPFLDDSARQADLVLPVHTDLESWGDIEPAAGARTPVVGLQQPVVAPVHDSRSFGDILLALGRAAGGDEKLLPWPSFREMLRARIRHRLDPGDDGDFETEWVGLLQAGGLFEPANGVAPSGRFGGSGTPLPRLAAARTAGAEGDFPLHLQVYPSPALTDGRGAHLPWLQQLPDPMSTAVWGSWLELNPQTAAALGIGEGDLVEVRSPEGAIRLPAVLYPGLRPEVVAIPMGQGHRGMGRYADGRGASPLELLAPLEGEGSLPAWGATRVALRRLPGSGGLVAAGNSEGSYRRELLGL